MKEFHVSMLAAESSFYEGPCESLVIPSTEGEYGILANHSNMVAAVVPGELRYTLPGQAPQIAFVSSGLIKVANNSVLILADIMERPQEIDANRAKRAEEAAREELMQKLSEQEYTMTRMRLARAINRMRVKEKSVKKD